MKNSMNMLIEQVKKLRNSPIRDVIYQRMKEFSSFRSASPADIYKELCFCFLTANFNAERSIAIQQDIGDGFFLFSESQLADRLAYHGHRFPKARASFIVQSRHLKDTLKSTLSSFQDDRDARQWVVDNVKGIGYKESSHFLRNIGRFNVAIIDYHIIDLLVKHSLISRPKTLTKNRYLEIESVLEKLSQAVQLSLGELDLYLWYMETGKILK